MSNAIFPTFPGLAWSVYKTPEWSTSAQRAVSGKEIRMANRARPVWLFSLSYEILRGASVLQEYQKLLAFYNARQGSFDSFLFNDTSDNTATAQPVGTGDGVRTSWPLTHQIGGWSEPIGAAQYMSLSVNGNIMAGGTHKNMLPYSNLGVAGTYGNSDVGSVDNYGVTPDGTVTSSKISSGTRYRVATGLTVGAQYTYSEFVKSAGGSGVDLYSDGSTPPGTLQSAHFSFTSGVITSPSGIQTTSVTAIPGGWWRISMTFIATATTAYYHYYPSGGAVEFWGAQLEPGATPTSLDPTTDLTAAEFTCADGVNVTFNTPPPAGATITWSGQFYYRMRFDRDTMEFEQFMRDFWALKKCDLRGVI